MPTPTKKRRVAANRAKSSATRSKTRATTSKKWAPAIERPSAGHAAAYVDTLIANGQAAPLTPEGKLPAGAMHKDAQDRDRRTALGEGGAPRPLNRVIGHRSRAAGRVALLIAALLLPIDRGAAQTPASRTFRPDDMFRVQRVGTVAWSPDGRYAAIEFTKPGPWLDAIPNNDIALLDVRARTIRPLSSRAASYLGFFNAAWSPDGRRLAFLSVDGEATIRLWTWTVGAAKPSVVANLGVRTEPGDPPIAWIDASRLAAIAWDAGAQKSGSLHAQILRGRNVADAWKRAADGRTAAVFVLESGVTPMPTAAVQLVALDVASGTRKTLARGRIHRLSVSPDGCCVSFLQHNPGVPGQPIASYFERADNAGNADAAYTAVNWGTDRHTVDARSGLEVAAAAPASVAARPAPTADAPPSPPRTDARQLSVSPSGDAALYLAQGADGSRLWLSGGRGRPLSSSVEIWRANAWMSEITLGRAEPIPYTAGDGTSEHAWLLLPPNHGPGTKVPLVTVVYPGSVYGASPPRSFSPFVPNFEHPQLFAALGYGVLMPSIVAPKDRLEAKTVESFLSGVMPAVDAAIARGFVDPDRIAVVGQSDGGFAVLSLITRTRRFRSAIASASYSNLVSMYGTLQGRTRYGDFAAPEPTQVLRMLQFERGAMGTSAPPWAAPSEYHDKSPVLHAGKVQTPLMLIHGDLDSIPIQQAEEFFTALLRQDKRALLVRYGGEGHTIAGRSNVLDLWRRIADWLTETLTPRDPASSRP